MMRIGRKLKIGLAMLLAIVVMGCVTVGPNATTTQPRILAMGDSMMAWNGGADNSIPEVIAQELGQPVMSRAISGAHIIYNLPISGSAGYKISNQYVQGEWDWVVVNGGGNDLWLGCGCNDCTKRMNRMISTDGAQGEIPTMVSQLRATGAKVVYLGYLRSPGVGSIIEHCRDDGDELEKRLARMAKGMNGVYFVSVASLVPDGDRSFHSLDMIHPSIKGSTEIGKRAAKIMKRASSG
ncbi:MAG: SGNH/GDSL hydrolase family protein [Paracoccaceae bacterium]